jgi:uncharacterized Rossmann fold enzyme
MSRWKRKTVAVIGSGPSLTEHDCQLIEAAGLPTVVTNTTWKIAPFCDVIMGADHAWWRDNHDKITVPAERVTISQNAARQFGLSQYGKTRTSKFSGLRAIEYAMDEGANRIILLGFDCSTRKGTHWHGNHVGLGNPDGNRCKKWQFWLLELSMVAKKRCVEIINCSRETAVTHFPRMPLEKALSKIGAINRD